MGGKSAQKSVKNIVSYCLDIGIIDDIKYI